MTWSGDIFELTLATSETHLFAGTAIGTGPKLLGNGGMAARREADGTNLYVCDGWRQAVLNLNLATAVRSEVVGPATSTPAPFFEVRDLVFDPEPDPNWSPSYTIFVLDQSIDGVFHIDPKAPDLEEFSGTAWDNGWFFDIVKRFALDTKNDRLIVTGAASSLPSGIPLRGLFSIAQHGGRSAPVSTQDLGSGPTWQTPEAIAVDSEASQAFVVDAGFSTLLKVDLATGNRVVLAQHPFSDPVVDVAFDGARRRLLTLQAWPQLALYS